LKGEATNSLAGFSPWPTIRLRHCCPVLVVCGVRRTLPKVAVLYVDHAKRSAAELLTPTHDCNVKHSPRATAVPRRLDVAHAPHDHADELVPGSRDAHSDPVSHKARIGMAEHVAGAPGTHVASSLRSTVIDGHFGADPFTI